MLHKALLTLPKVLLTLPKALLMPPKALLTLPKTPSRNKAVCNIEKPACGPAFLLVWSIA
jgi:hypothetical protein